jgi:hypothetical protein
MVGLIWVLNEGFRLQIFDLAAGWIILNRVIIVVVQPLIIGTICSKT